MPHLISSQLSSSPVFLESACSLACSLRYQCHNHFIPDQPNHPKTTSSSPHYSHSDFQSISISISTTISIQQALIGSHRPPSVISHITPCLHVSTFTHVCWLEAQPHVTLHIDKKKRDDNLTCACRTRSKTILPNTNM